MDTAYRLSVSTPSGGTVGLEPAETVGFPTPVPEEGAAVVTHGGAVELGAEGCEVLAPWNISFVVATVRPTL